MAKITSKLQVTVLKAIARRYGIEPGDEVRFEAAGEAIRIVPARSSAALPLDREARLALFDAATQRQRERDREVRARSLRRRKSLNRGDACVGSSQFSRSENLQERPTGARSRRQVSDRGWRREDLYTRGDAD